MAFLSNSRVLLWRKEWGSTNRSFFKDIYDTKSMAQTCVDWNTRIVNHKLNSLGDLLHYQDKLVQTLNIPRKFSERKPYQNKVYKVIRNRERKLFTEVCRISHAWYGQPDTQGKELSQLPCKKVENVRSYFKSTGLCNTDPKTGRS